MGLLSIVALLTTQAYWLVRALTLREKAFSQNVHMALKETAQQLRQYNGTPEVLIDPVDQLSDNYYVVMVNDVIDANVLEHYLTQNLKLRSVLADFEYGVYDCNNEQLAYGNYVSLDGSAEPYVPSELPRLDKENYYFGVLFPQQEVSLTGQLVFIVGGVAFTLLVVGFFGYTLVVITRQRRLSEVQRDFINNMTHEFKTPLSTVTISSRVLQDPAQTTDPARVHRYASIIGEEAQRLLEQVDRILQMARADRGGERLQKEPLDLATVVAEVLEQHGPALEAAQAEIVTHLASAPLVGDPLHVKSMLFTLLDNALKYTTAPAHITITTEVVKGKSLVRVSDQGVGLTPAQQRRIFDKFYRVPTGDVHDVKGFGLGLTYVKHIMQRHRGKVKVSSTLGQGSTFTLIFPQAT